MANAPIPCHVCGSLHTRVRDTVPIPPGDVDDERYVRLFATMRQELGREGSLTGALRVQLLKCSSCPVDEDGRPRVYRLTYLPPTFAETGERYLRLGSPARLSADGRRGSGERPEGGAQMRRKEGR